MASHKQINAILKEKVAAKIWVDTDRDQTPIHFFSRSWTQAPAGNYQGWLMFELNDKLKEL